MSNNVIVGEITLLFVGMTDDKDERNQQEIFAVPGRGKVVGRGNAVRAAKGLANSNEQLRVKARGY